MKVKKKEGQTYIFVSRVKSFGMFIDNKFIQFVNGEFKTDDQILAEKLRAKIEKNGYFRELSAVEIYQRNKRQEEKKEEPKTIQEVVQEIEEKRKHLLACEHCGKEFATEIDYFTHKYKKHPEIYMLKDAMRRKQNLNMYYRRYVTKKALANLEKD